jgi:hypothetical protein
VQQKGQLTFDELRANGTILLIYNDQKAGAGNKAISLETFRIAVEEFLQTQSQEYISSNPEIDSNMIEQAFKNLKIQDEMVEENAKKGQFGEMNTWHRAYVDGTD